MFFGVSSLISFGMEEENRGGGRFRRPILIKEVATQTDFAT